MAVGPGLTPRNGAPANRRYLLCSVSGQIKFCRGEGGKKRHFGAIWPSLRKNLLRSESLTGFGGQAWGGYIAPMPLEFIRRLLSPSDQTRLTNHDARAAIAAVLVMAARADHHYDARERAMIDEVLARRFALGPGEARRLREEGEAAEAEAIDLFQFTRAIKRAIPHDDRMAILEELWGVVLADGVRDPHED